MIGQQPMTSRWRRVVAAIAAAVATGAAVAWATAPATAPIGPSPLPAGFAVPADPAPGPVVGKPLLVPLDQPIARPATPPPPAVVEPPVSLAIPTLGVSMPIQSVSVRDDGQLDVPADPGVAGWYRFGAAPASPTGATVLAAHVDSRRYGVGPFAQLPELRSGDEVIVTVAGGEIRYRVAELRAVPKDDLNPAGLFDRSGAARLHLVTCGGDYDNSAGWSANVIVIAERVG